MSSATPADPRRVLTVSQLVGVSRDLLADALPFVWVRGEVSGFSAHPSGHWYFDLKDRKALVPVAMFQRANKGVRFRVEEGMELIVGGEATIYVARGKFQIIAEALEPVGWGALQLAYEQLKQRLADEGLFEPGRKRALPVLPGCVGVVTSRRGAAWSDMCRVWSKNQVPIRAILAPARVQGDGAAAEIATAIERLNRHGRAEVIIVGRGGGSREDLWAFNEEPVARAIAASAIPVVAAVGHEIDTTIADLVADRSAPTPTAAAELVAASRGSLLTRLDAAERRAQASVSHRVMAAKNRLREPYLQRFLREPGRLLAAYRQRLDDALNEVSRPVLRSLDGAQDRLDRQARRLVARGPKAAAIMRRSRAHAALAASRGALERLVDKRRTRLAAAAARIEALSPLAVLGRGYAICERAADGAIVRAATDVSAGDKVRIKLARDTLECAVETTTESRDPVRL